MFIQDLGVGTRRPMPAARTSCIETGSDFHSPIMFTLLYVVFLPRRAKNDIQRRQSTMLPQAKSAGAKALQLHNQLEQPPPVGCAGDLLPQTRQFGQQRSA